MPLVCLSLALPGCNTGSMVVDSSAGRTIYSKYYDQGDWIIPHHLGMSVVVDHEKTEIPVFHGVQQSMGALGPGDAVVRGKVTVYLWNRDREAHRVRILRITSAGATLTPPNVVFVGVEGQRTGGEVGVIEISNYGTEIPIKIDYDIDGKAASKHLILERRTYDQLKKYFGPGGVPPYPWYQDISQKG